jgi:preprotein translocase subunit SecA
LVCKVKDDKEEWEVPLMMMEVSMGDRNLQLLEDYRWWFSEWGGHASIPHPHVSDDYQDEEDDEPEPPPKKVGRNDPCPCGSGKKFKKCCLHKQGSDLFD